MRHWWVRLKCYFFFDEQSACFSQCIVKPNQRLCFLQLTSILKLQLLEIPCVSLYIFAKNHVTHLSKSADSTLWMWRICSLINHRWTKSACFSHIQLQEKSYQKHFWCWFELQSSDCIKGLTISTWFNCVKQETSVPWCSEDQTQLDDLWSGMIVKIHFCLLDNARFVRSSTVVSLFVRYAVF